MNATLPFRHLIIHTTWVAGLGRTPSRRPEAGRPGAQWRGCAAAASARRPRRRCPTATAKRGPAAPSARPPSLCRGKHCLRSDGMYRLEVIGSLSKGLCVERKSDLGESHKMCRLNKDKSDWPSPAYSYLNSRGASRLRSSRGPAHQELVEALRCRHHRAPRFRHAEAARHEVALHLQSSQRCSV